MIKKGRRFGRYHTQIHAALIPYFLFLIYVFANKSTAILMVTLQVAADIVFAHFLDAHLAVAY